MAEIMRFVALDVHKHYILVAAINAKQEITLSPRRVSMETCPDWIRQHLTNNDAVVLEATTNAWTLYDVVEPLVAEVKVAHPLLVKLISCAKVKTDTRDMLHLARLLSAGLIPEVWIPPKPVRELRILVAHHQRLIRQRTQARNRIQSVLHQHNLLPPPGKPFATCHTAWWEGLDLPASERLRVLQDLAIMQVVDQQVSEVDEELHRLSAQEPWAEQVTFLMQLSGFAVVNSMTLLAGIGDITRFPQPSTSSVTVG